MPRLVRLTQATPVKLEPRDKPYFVCACGLSRTFPLCDGSHKKLPATEPDPGTLYVYDKDRVNITEHRREDPVALGGE